MLSVSTCDFLPTICWLKSRRQNGISVRESKFGRCDSRHKNSLLELRSGSFFYKFPTWVNAKNNNTLRTLSTRYALKKNQNFRSINACGCVSD
jgi:hypothetical protein